MPDRSGEQALRRQVREDRGMILDMLNQVYPAGLIERDLLDSVLDLPRPVEGHNARRDLGYLGQLGLIESLREVHPITHRPCVRYRLTAKGVQFVECGKDWAAVETV